MSTRSLLSHGRDSNGADAVNLLDNRGGRVEYDSSGCS